MTTKIESLQAYLSRIAKKLHYTYYQSTPVDDILQEMNLFILERAEGDPEFLSQENGYITRAAAWHARDWMDPKSKGTNYLVNKEAFSLDAETPDASDAAETLADESPDTDTQIAVRQALTGLDGVAADIAKLMLSGMKIGEAATELGISKQSANYYKKAIAATLSPVYQAM